MKTMDDVQVAALAAATLLASDPHYGEFGQVVLDKYREIQQARAALRDNDELFDDEDPSNGGYQQMVFTR